MNSVPSFVNFAVAVPSLSTIQETVSDALDRMQAWSDETFGGKYRDAAETLICGLILLLCNTALRTYVIAKVCIPLIFSYWQTVAEQQFLAESGLWLEQLAFELLPANQCFDECWAELELQVSANQQILSYEVATSAIAAETC